MTSQTVREVMLSGSQRALAEQDLCSRSRRTASASQRIAQGSRFTEPSVMNVARRSLSRRCKRRCSVSQQQMPFNAAAQNQGANTDLASLAHPTTHSSRLRLSHYNPGRCHGAQHQGHFYHHAGHDPAGEKHRVVACSAVMEQNVCMLIETECWVLNGSTSCQWLTLPVVVFCAASCRPAVQHLGQQPRVTPAFPEGHSRPWQVSTW